MTLDCTLWLTKKNGDMINLTSCISFYLKKEIYMPYSQLNAEFFTNGVDINISDIKEIKMQVGNDYVHSGLVDELTISEKKGTIKVSSRSYGILLGQNQPKPGINSNINLFSLVKNHVASSHIAVESGAPETNYIYVKEGSTVWDAVIAYSLKINGYYPYVRNNVVYVTLNPIKNVPLGDIILDKGESLSTTSMLSKIYMKDTEDSYSFNRENNMAASYNIVRTKYYNLDRQWLSDSNIGLDGKINYSNRKYHYVYYTYSGFQGEELMDKITNGMDKTFGGKYISEITVWGNNGKINTKICCYLDKLSQRL